MLARLIIALGIVAAYGTTRSFRRSPSPFLQALARPRGVQPTGEGGLWTRRDHLRAAAAQGLTFAFATALGLFVLGLADHWKTGTRENEIASIPGLAAMMYGMFFLFLCGRSLIRAAFGWQPSRASIAA